MSNTPNMDESIEMAAVFRALADPFRLHAFTLLLRRARDAPDGRDSGLDMADAVDDIVVGTNMSPGLAEQHLMELARVNLVDIHEEPGGRLQVTVDLAVLSRARRLVGEAGGDADTPRSGG